MESKYENRAPATNAAGSSSSADQSNHAVSCDGAAVIIGGVCQCLGASPNESHLKDLVQWLMRTHGDSTTGLFTESLAGAGYPRADVLGDAGICGMAAQRFSSSGFLFLFRSKNNNDTSCLPWEPTDIDSAHTMIQIIKDYVYREENMEKWEDDENKQLAIVEASGWRRKMSKSLFWEVWSIFYG